MSPYPPDEDLDDLHNPYRYNPNRDSPELPLPKETSEASSATTASTPEADPVENAAVLQAIRMLQSSYPLLRPGVRYRSSLTLFGIPWLSIARGPDFEKGEMVGHARGIIAIGDFATGCFALGGFSRGLIAVGGVALGCLSMGGCSLGLLFALGGLAFGSVAIGGCAIGGIALGGCAIGYFACGGMAVGFYALGANAVGTHTFTPLKQDPAVMDFVNTWAPLIKPLLPKIK